VFSFYKSLNCFVVRWSLFFVKLGPIFLLRGLLFRFHVFLHVRGPMKDDYFALSVKKFYCFSCLFTIWDVACLFEAIA